ncbi:MAG: helix-turn-helix transcriptional regulator, partial [Chloroflexi bacterium]
MDELLSTKLFIPHPRPNLVSRPRLTERLHSGAERKLTLIAAPAGFGKTTLLSEWTQQNPQNIAWISIDKNDKDPNMFWTYFITSLQHIYPQLGDKPLTLLHSSQAPPITSILTALINEISAIPEDITVVIDDYYLIDFQPIHDALSFLIDHLPSNLHLVITTRSDPPLPLARLRAHHQLVELRAKDLRFSLDE